MITIRLVLLILAFLCALGAAAGAATRINLVGLALALYILAVTLGNT